LWSKRPSKKIYQWNRESSGDEGDNPKIPLWFLKGIKEMGQNKEKGRMKVNRIFFIKLDLFLETVTRIIIGVNFIQPK
jgi:hypothetical protein